MINGFKGFDKDLKCRGFQFEVGGKYEEKKAIACEAGFHFCEFPFDVFGYYAPADSRFCAVVGKGKTDKHSSDSKVACTKLEVGAEIGLPGIISAGVKFILEKAESKENATGDQSAATNTGDQSAATNTGNQSAATNTGYQSAATNTGNQSAATNTGNRSAATNTGYRSAATNTGYRSVATNTGYQSAATVESKESVAIATGYESKARGALGCWIVLSEWKEIDNEYNIIDVQSAKVDGEKIKADTFYRLVNGEFVEEDDE